MPRKSRRAERNPGAGFDLAAYLGPQSPAQAVLAYPRGRVVFSQGDPATHVKYIQAGGIRLSVVSKTGKEAVVAMLSPGDFFGESVLVGQKTRIETATAVSQTSILAIEKDAMVCLLHDDPEFSDRFITHMLTRNARIEADLVDQLFNSSEKRLARTLLLMARYGQAGPDQTLPRVSQETLAEMVGTTRSRVNFFMNKFRRLGLIEYNGTLKINSSLLTVVLHD